MFNPTDVLECVLAHLDDRGRDAPPTAPSLVPWYRGFRGAIRVEENGDFTSTGTYHVDGGNVHITQLPIGAKESNEVVEDLKKRLMGNDPKKHFAIDVLQNTTNIWQTDIVIKSTRDRLEQVDDLASLLGLEKKLSLGNIHLWSADGKLKRYTIPQIVSEHADARLDAYAQRLVHQIRETEDDLRVASAKRLFIELVRAGDLDLNVDTRAQLEASIEAHQLPRVKDSFHYLVALPAYTLTLEQLAKLRDQEAGLRGRLAELAATTPAQLWRHELAALRTALGEYDARAQSERD